MPDFVKINCEVCGYNKVIDIYDTKTKLVEYQRSKIQSNLPTLDPNTQQTVIHKFKTLPKRYKCPGCGRLANVKEIKETPFENKPKVIYAEDINKGSAGGFERM